MRKATDKRLDLKRVPPRNLAREVVQRLSAEISGGRLTPGARLPTEHALMAAMGVSRTVVREAIAALRAEGMVVTRQGLGAFVSTDVRSRPFRIDRDGLRSIGEVLNVMELRMAIEAEAAGFAAERASGAQLSAIGDALESIEAAIARGESAIDEDFAFHHAIADATGNPQFTGFLGYLGRFIIPRQSVRVEAPPRGGQRPYLEAIQAEHRAIFGAIRGHDAAGAREAMRRHLVNGRERYRKLASKSADG